MPKLLVQGASLVFEPVPGVWNWQGWNGQVQLTVTADAMTAQGKKVAVNTDLVALNKMLLGKPYITPAFSDAPGSVLSATIVVMAGTLSQKTVVGGKPAATEATRGTFFINVAPAQMTKTTPPTPDPVVTKTGTWRVQSAGQAAAESA